MSKYEMGYQQQEDLAADARRPATEVGETCECPGGVACSHDGPCEGDVERSLEAARGEKRQRDRRGEGPCFASTSEQAIQLAARGAIGTGQVDIRQEGGPRCADVGVGGFQPMLRTDDVRTVK